MAKLSNTVTAAYEIGKLYDAAKDKDAMGWRCGR